MEKIVLGILMVVLFAIPCEAEVAIDVSSSTEGTLWNACGLSVYIPMLEIIPSCTDWGFHQGQPYSCGDHNMGRGYHCLTGFANLNYVDSELGSIMYSFYYDEFFETLYVGFYIMPPSGVGVYMKSRYGLVFPFLYAFETGVMTRIEDNWVPSEGE